MLPHKFHQKQPLSKLPMRWPYYVLSEPPGPQGLELAQSKLGQQCPLASGTRVVSRLVTQLLNSIAYKELSVSTSQLLCSIDIGPQSPDSAQCMKSHPCLTGWLRVKCFQLNSTVNWPPTLLYFQVSTSCTQHSQRVSAAHSPSWQSTRPIKNLNTEGRSQDGPSNICLAGDGLHHLKTVTPQGDFPQTGPLIDHGCLGCSLPL